MKMRHALILSSLALGISWGALSLAGCPSTGSTPTSSPTPTASGAVAATIQNYAFSPNPLNVAVGSTVTWTNKDTVAHTVTSNTGLFDSGAINPGASWSHTFSTAGTFAYHCSIHTYMTGTVTVQ